MEANPDADPAPGCVSEAAPSLRRVGLGLPLALYAFVVLQSAWLCDDAYITYRTVENFVSGLGLRWNPIERVQAYTHPLWMFVISGGYAASGNLYWTALGASMLCSFGAVFLLVARLARSPWSAAVAVATLTASSAFVDYSTSGLENPLTHLLVVAFFVRFLGRPFDARNLAWLGALVGLAALNRLDTVLFYLPALGYALVRFGQWRGLAIVALGFTPLLVWELFSLVYYGFPFPNTAYAKLKLFLPRDALVTQGFHYLASSLRHDPITGVAIVAGGALALWARSRESLLVLAGALLYVGYVVFIGGDFMAGRMLSAPLLVGAILLANAEPLSRRVPAGLALVAILVLAVPGLRGSGGGETAYEDLIDEHGITDERRYYEPFTGLRHYSLHGGVPDHPWTAEGEQARRSGQRVVLMQAAGFFGHAAGPGVHVVDPHGLSEPFLARLPPPALPDWRIGHLWRELPAGYWETLPDRESRIVDPGLAAYREALVLITRGELFSSERFAAILGMALGRYESLLPIQALRFPPTKTIRASEWTGEELPMDWRGVDVRFAESVRARDLELRASGDDGYDFVFFAGERDIGQVKRAPRPGADPALGTVRLEVPAAVQATGFDRIRVLPYGGDGRYRIAGITLP
jgi:arabinofuranosyltransferase